MKVISLWSGGKDSCFAYYKAIQEDYDVLSLCNFTDSKARYSLSHGLSAELIQRQGATIEIPFSQKIMPKETYREDFIRLITEWKVKERIGGVVFGDIYLEGHKEWIDKVCQEAGVKAIMPLWGKDTQGLVREFINIGFKAIVVATNAALLGEDWLGLSLDRIFLKRLEENEEIDPCGEKGEFHTFVYDGPIFKKPVEFSIGEKRLKNGHWFLQLSPE